MVTLRNMPVTTRLSMAGGAASIILALCGFLLSSQVDRFFPVSPVLPKPHTIPTSETLFFTGTIGVNPDTNPLTIGPPSASTLTVAEAYNVIDFTVKIPSSLGYIADDTSSPPSLSACQVAIATGPTPIASIQDEGWICIRTAAGATKAIRIAAINPANTELEIFTLHDLRSFIVGTSAASERGARLPSPAQVLGGDQTAGPAGR